MKSIINIFVLCFASFAFAATPKRPPQFVALAFDGSKTVSFWESSLEFIREMREELPKENKIAFTYFMNAVYFLADAKKKNYVEPGHGAGASAIGFGGTEAAIQQRLDYVKVAMDEGHEMASHANGHYDGSGYNETQWTSEFQQFESLMKNVWTDNKVASKQPADWVSYFTYPQDNEKFESAINHVVGFRAPQLGVSQGLWNTLAKNNFMYDTSKVDKMGYWPKKPNGYWNFPLASLIIKGTNKKTLSMDYNFYVADSKGAPDGNAANHKIYEERMYKTYMSYFANNYLGNRAPLHIGHHFSLWNGGAYWKAMKRFAKEVCGRPEVVCGTYKDLVVFMEQNKGSVPDYEKANFSNGKYVDNTGLSQNLAGGIRELEDDEIEELRLESSKHFNAHADEGD